MNPNLQPIDCDLCGSADKKFIKEENGFPISRCLNCSFVYVSSIPPVETGKVVGEYYHGTDDEIESARHRYTKVSRFLLDQLASLKPDKGRLLDVGCGYGYFLRSARDEGWDVYGTELSELAVNYNHKKQGLPQVFFSDLSDDVFEDTRFDAINTTNVMEHVPSPTTIFENCRRRLAENGILFIRVPNMDLYAFKESFNSLLQLVGLVKGGERHYLASPPPSHLAGFNSRTLRKYFEKTGFETVEIKPSKLSSQAEENIVYRLFERSVDVLFKLSFGRINLSPTILAIARKRS